VAESKDVSGLAMQHDTTSVPILVFLGVSVLELGPMYATDRRQTDVRQMSDKSSA